MNENQRLLGEIRRSHGWFTATVAAGLVSGGLIIWQAKSLSHLINGVFLEHKTQQAVLPLVLTLAAIFLLRSLVTFLGGSSAAALSAKIKTALRHQLLQKIDRLGPSFTRGESTGELTTTALQGVEALDAYFSQYLPQLLVASLVPLLILLVVFPLDTLTGVIFLVTAPLIPVFMNLIGRASESETRRQWQGLSRLGAYFLDTLQGLTTLKTLGQSQARTKQIEEVSEKYRETTLRVLRITFLSALVLEMLATLSTAIVAVEIGLRLLYSQIAFEQAFFILLIAPEFYQPLRQLGARFHAGMNGVTAAKRIYQVLDAAEPENSVLSNPKSPILEGRSFRLELQNVSYAFPDQQQAALRDVTITLNSGSSHGLVGRSGAGKTTLLQLLLRFIIPTDGRILLNGEEVEGFSLEQWRRQIAWVAQRPGLLDATILENIRMARPGASFMEVRRAAALAHLDSFVMSLRDGYETWIFENAARMSSGQAQRIALARAFLKDAPILLMDEPTAHLDVEIEEGLMASVQTLMRGRTTVVIAHRLSTLREMDEIFLLDEGRLLEHGSHARLMEASALYRQMVQLQRGAA
jgi:ATP-binding cassette subfamily C protein CydD